MSSSTLEEILSDRKKIFEKAIKIRNNFFSEDSSKEENSKEKKRRNIDFDKRIREISHLSDNLIFEYLQNVQDAIYSKSHIDYPENLHKLYTYFGSENLEILERTIDILSKYNLSVFYFEETAKFIFKSVTDKSMSKIKKDVELVLDIIEEDTKKFSVDEFDGVKKVNHFKKIFSLTDKFNSVDLERYANIHREIRSLAKRNSKNKHLARNFLYRFVDLEEDSQDKFSACEFALDVCKDNLDFFPSDFELFFKTHLKLGGEKTVNWYENFMKSADRSRIKPTLSYLREAIYCQSKVDLDSVLQNTQDMLSLYSLNEYMLTNINLKTNNRHINVKIQEIDSLLSIIKTVEQEAFEREENIERIRECVGAITLNVLKEDSPQRRSRIAQIFVNYHKEVCSKFKNGKEYMNSVAQLFSSQDNLLHLSDEALTAVYATVESNRKSSKIVSKKEVVKRVLDDLDEDISRLRIGGVETRLNEFHKTLEIYANMIAGRNYSVRIEEGDTSSMRCEQENNILVIRLPAVISYFKEFQKNKDLFRALTTIFAGHARYSSGKLEDGSFVNISELSQKFDNPDLYKFVLQISENHRIRNHLSQEYSGFAEDSSLLVQYLSKLLFQGAFTNADDKDPKKILRQLITQSFYKNGQERNEKINEALSLVESKNASFEDSVACSKKIYSLIKNSIALTLKPEEKKFELIPLEQIVSALENIKLSAIEVKQATTQFTYPEFDVKKGHLIEGAVSVHLVPPPTLKFVPKIFANFDESVLSRIKEQLEYLKPNEKDRTYGSKGILDMDRFQNWKARRMAGICDGANDVCIQPVYNRRKVATAIAIEHSGSTKRFVGEQKQRTFVADYMKRLTQHLVEFMHTLGDDVAAYAYQGVGAHNVQCMNILDFGEEFNLEAYKSLAALESKGNNRDGAIIRHVSSQLSQHSANTRVFLNITDGVPHDECYKDEYAFADVRMACRELESVGIIPIRLVVDPTLKAEQIKELEDEYTLVLTNFHSALEQLPFLYYDKTK